MPSLSPTTAEEAQGPAPSIAIEREQAAPAPAHSTEYREITEAVLARMGEGGKGYVLILAGTALLMVLGAVAWGFQLWYGVGVSGLQHPMMWATYITSFVWWIGIAHAGTLLSAVLYLTGATFRPAFSRLAEGIALMAVLAAASYPIIHLGRAWRFYWLLPYPNQRDLWVTFRSPLIFDVFALLADFAISLLFFWAGLLPDLAVLRDRSVGWKRTLYGVLALGWEGRASQWKHFRAGYSVLAGLVAVLVIAGHTVVSWDFSLALVPGWHSTLFPLYFLAGAIFTGLAMSLLFIVPLRGWLRLHRCISDENLDRIARLLLGASLFLTFFRSLEFYLVWLRGSELARIDLLYKSAGPFALVFWTMIVCNSLVPLAFLWQRVRRSAVALVLVALTVCVGMWLERLIIITASLGRDYLPYAWAPGAYSMTLLEWGIFAGTAGWFFFSLLLFVRYFPVLPMHEIKRNRLRHAREEQAMARGEPPPD